MIHCSLGYLTPTEFEASFSQQQHVERLLEIFLHDWALVTR